MTYRFLEPKDEIRNTLLPRSIAYRLKNGERRKGSWVGRIITKISRIKCEAQLQNTRPSEMLQELSKRIVRIEANDWRQELVQRSVQEQQHFVQFRLSLRVGQY